MTMRNKKTAMLSVLSILALSMMGFAYALWSETLTISGSVATGEVNWEFVPMYNFADHGIDWLGDCSWHLWLSDKDVGGPTILLPVDTDGDGDMDTLQVTLNNAYPQYFENIGFHVKILGTVPIIVDNIVIEGTVYRLPPQTIFLDLDDDGLDDIKILWGNHIGSQLHPGDIAEVSFYILVLQEAPQGASLTFTITLTAVQYNEYVPPPP